MESPNPLLAAVQEALNSFCDVARQELHRLPMRVPEATEETSRRDIAFVRWGLNLLENDPAFHTLSAAVDAAYLEEHRRAMGEGREPRNPDDDGKAVAITTLTQHLRCFFRRSRAHLRWLQEQDVDRTKLGSLLVADLRRAETVVHVFVWLEGVDRPDRGGMPYAQ